MTNEKGDRTGGMTAGIVLISIGLLFLADRFDWLDLGPSWSWWQWWPVILIAVGLAKFLPGHTASDRAGAVFTILLGTWFLAVMNDWYGLSFSNSWPLVLVAIGGSMVARSLVDRGSRRRRDPGGFAAGHVSNELGAAPRRGGEGGHDAR